ncbi:MAG: hypothetical protein IH800_14870 [Myxococcales bacterium]|nr:hypothetical protein [Myxococcales bacterium]
MARVLLRIPLCLLLVAASEANEAELDFKQLDLSGEWYVLIHYKDQRSEHKSITKFKDFAWSIRQTPGLLVWESYPYVLFSDELELIRRHAMLEHLPWEPDETLWQQIRDTLDVSARAVTKKRLRGSVPEGYKSKPPRAGGLGTLTFSRDWDVSFSEAEIRIQVIDSLSGTQGLAGMQEVTVFEIREQVAPDELRGRWQEGSRRGTFRMVRARQRRLVK